MHSRANRKGFTLVEVIVASTLGTLILAGVLSTVLMLGRSGANASNYSSMEMQSRRALEELSQDLRMASDILWNSSTSITLLVADNYTSTSNLVTYAYDSASKTFYRMPGRATDKNPTTTLINNVETFSYSRYDRMDIQVSSAVPSDSSSARALELKTKRVQLAMTVRITTATAASTSNHILSASFILRNKPAN